MVYKRKSNSKKCKCSCPSIRRSRDDNMYDDYTSEEMEMAIEKVGKGQKLTPKEKTLINEL